MTIASGQPDNGLAMSTSARAGPLLISGHGYSFPFPEARADDDHAPLGNAMRQPRAATTGRIIPGGCISNLDRGTRSFLLAVKWTRILGPGAYTDLS
jgi:hypothetical protein